MILCRPYNRSVTNNVTDAAEVMAGLHNSPAVSKESNPPKMSASPGTLEIHQELLKSVPLQAVPKAVNEVVAGPLDSRRKKLAIKATSGMHPKKLKLPPGAGVLQKADDDSSSRDKGMEASKKAKSPKEKSHSASLKKKSRSAAATKASNRNDDSSSDKPMEASTKDNRPKKKSPPAAATKAASSHDDSSSGDEEDASKKASWLRPPLPTAATREGSKKAQGGKGKLNKPPREPKVFTLRSATRRRPTTTRTSPLILQGSSGDFQLRIFGVRLSQPIKSSRPLTSRHPTSSLKRRLLLNMAEPRQTRLPLLFESHPDGSILPSPHVYGSFGC